MLFATARNVTRDLFRRRTTANTFPIAEIDESRVFDDVPNAAETASCQRETDLLATAIAELPPRCREILVLRKLKTFPLATLPKVSALGDARAGDQQGIIFPVRRFR